MKKALVLALTVLMVLSLATAAFAAEVTYSGKVKVKWGNEISHNPTLELDEEGEVVEKATDKDTGFKNDALEAKIEVALTEDYGNGVTAGVKTKVEAQADVYNDDNEVNKEYKFDGGGWVQLERDLFTLKASTDIDGNAAKDLGGENALAGAPGVGLDLRLMDGLTVNTVLNAGSEYGYLVKGEFAEDLFTIGAGFQSETAGNRVKADKEYDITANRSVYAVYGSVNVIEPLTVKAEYSGRKYTLSDDTKEVLESLDPEFGFEFDKETDITGLLASAAFVQDAIDAKASFLMQDAGFNSLKDDDADQDWRLNEDYRFKPTYDVSVLFLDASYKLTEDIEIGGYFDYLLSVKLDGNKLAEEVENKIDKTSYKVNAAYTMDDLKFEGWYKAYHNSQVGGKTTYTLAEDVNASFEVAYTKFAEKVGDKDGKVSYSAVVEAKL